MNVDKARGKSDDKQHGGEGPQTPEQADGEHAGCNYAADQDEKPAAPAGAEDTGGESAQQSSGGGGGDEDAVSHGRGETGAGDPREPDAEGAGDAEIEARRNQQQRPQGVIAVHIFETGDDGLPHARPCGADGGHRRIGQLPQRADDEEKADGVDDEGPGRAQRFHDQSGRRGADDGAELYRDLRDGVGGRKLLRLDQRGHEGLGRGHAEGIGHAKGKRQNIEMPKLQHVYPQQRADRAHKDGAGRGGHDHDPAR